MKLRNATLVQFRAQIDEHVAATDQVQSREGRIGGEVLSCERADIAHAAMDLIGTIALDEKAIESRPWHIFLDRAWVNSRTRMLDDRFAQVGAENLDADFGKLVAKHFENANSERINLFACGATRYPDA